MDGFTTTGSPTMCKRRILIYLYTTLIDAVHAHTGTQVETVCLTHSHHSPRPPFTKRVGPPVSLGMSAEGAYKLSHPQCRCCTVTNRSVLIHTMSTLPASSRGLDGVLPERPIFGIARVLASTLAKK